MRLITKELKLLADGIRHDVTGTDHPVLRTGLGGPFHSGKRTSCDGR